MALWPSGPRAVRFLEWRLRIFGAGAVLGLAGIFLDISWLVTAALVVLIGGVAMRYTANPGAVDEEEGVVDPEA